MPDETQDDDALEPQEPEEPEGEHADEPLHDSKAVDEVDAVPQDGSAAGSLANHIMGLYGAGLREVIPKLDIPLPKLNLPFPKLEFPMPKLNFVVPSVDVSAMLPGARLAAISQQAFSVMSASLQSALNPIFPLLPEDFLKQLLDANKRILHAQPPNWWDVAMPRDLEVALALAVDEGLPLAWVPRPSTLDAILDAASPGERRRVLARRWKTTVTDCETELHAVREGEWGKYAQFALKSAAGLRAGHHELAQAMSISLLDTVLKKRFTERGANRRMDQNRRPQEIDRWTVRSAVVYGGIWGVHGRYRPDDDNLIPRKLSRHATTHGVSRRQYSRVNSVIALGHVTSLLRLLDSESDGSR